MATTGLTPEHLRLENDNEHDQFVECAKLEARRRAEQDIPKPQRGCRYTPLERKRNNLACARRSRRYKFHFTRLLLQEFEDLSMAVAKLEKETADLESHRPDHPIQPPPDRLPPQTDTAAASQHILNGLDNILVRQQDADDYLFADDMWNNEPFTDLHSFHQWPPF